MSAFDRHICDRKFGKLKKSSLHYRFLTFEKKERLLPKQYILKVVPIAMLLRRGPHFLCSVMAGGVFHHDRLPRVWSNDTTLLRTRIVYTFPSMTLVITRASWWRMRWVRRSLVQLDIGMQDTRTTINYHCCQRNLSFYHQDLQQPNFVTWGMKPNPNTKCCNSPNTNDPRMKPSRNQLQKPVSFKISEQLIGV